MEQPPPPLRSDPEFRSAYSEGSLPTVVDPAAYRRVLANPFLGFLGVGIWASAIRQAIFMAMEDTRLLMPSLAIIVPLSWFLPRLFRFQCLDCGRTGRASRWKAHVCPVVALRIVQGRPLRFRGPTPLVQTLLWGGVLIFALIFARASGITLR